MASAVERARRLRREMTFAERKLWEKLRKLKANIRRQVPIGPYIADFSHHATLTVIEVDGPLHDTPQAQAHDAKRTAWLQSEGYRVVRFTGKEAAEDTGRVVEQIAELLKLHSPLSPPFPLEGGRAGDGGESLSAESAGDEMPPESGIAAVQLTATAPVDGPSPPSPPFPPPGGRASSIEHV